MTYNFTPPSPSPVATGATEMIRKSLADKLTGLDWLPFEQVVIGLYFNPRDTSPGANPVALTLITAST